MSLNNIRSGNQIKENQYLKQADAFFLRNKFDENSTPVAQENPFNLTREIKAHQAYFSPGKKNAGRSRLIAGENCFQQHTETKYNNGNQKDSRFNKSQEFRSAFLKKFVNGAESSNNEKAFLRNINANGECSDLIVRANLFEETDNGVEISKKPFVLDRNLLYESEKSSPPAEENNFRRSVSQEKYSYSTGVSNMKAVKCDENLNKINEFRKKPLRQCESPAAKEKDFMVPSEICNTESLQPLKINSRIQEFLSDRESRIFLTNSEICNRLDDLQDKKTLPSKSDDIEEINSIVLSSIKAEGEPMGRMQEASAEQRKVNLEGIGAVCNLPLTEQGTLQFLFDEIASLKKSENSKTEELEKAKLEISDLQKRLAEMENKLAHVGKEKEIVKRKIIEFRNIKFCYYLRIFLNKQKFL